MTAARQTADAPVVALPGDLASNPRLSEWVSLLPDGTVEIRVGKVELGQGILTALGQIAAEELDVDLGSVTMVPADTAAGPDEGLTAGSRSIVTAGAALRQVCAEVRSLLVAAAADAFGADPAELTVRCGAVSYGVRRIGFGDLRRCVDLDREATGAAAPKPATSLRLVGTDADRLDLPDKVSGKPRYVHDLRLPGQLYGRVVRPPSPAATLVDVDWQQVERCPGVVSVVRDGSFLGVVAEDEETAESAAEALRDGSDWKEAPTLPDEHDLHRVLRGGPTDDTVVEDTGLTSTTQVTRRATARYGKPFIAHASMAPSCGVARWDGDHVTVWTHSQGVHPLRRTITAALDLGVDQVTTRHVEGAGCYGHNGADDAAFDAVLLARSAPGYPVQVRWSRQDELTWAPFGSAMSMDLEAGVDDSGAVVTWSYDVWSQGHTARPASVGPAGLLAATHLHEPYEVPTPADPPLPSGGTARNAAPLYAFPHRQVRAHRTLQPVLRSSALRALGAFGNVFAIESFVDELALAAGADPLEYRLAHLSDPRACAVLDAVADLAGWRTNRRGDDIGHGIGFARYKNTDAYCAVVAEVQATHEIRVRRLAIAVDVGRVVNPDGVRNQIEGGAVQATSWTVKERVRFDRERVTSSDWESYPILRFSETPHVEVRILPRQEQPSLGVGEAAQGPTAAAIGNAVADALGVRVRDLPITAERIVAAMEDT